MAALISLKDVTKVYRQGETEVRALNGVTLDINAGDFVAIMGPSGCGKSTLMYTIGFLDRPTAGTYTFDGKDAVKINEEGRAATRNARIGFIFQNYNLLPRTSVLDNVLLPTMYAENPDLPKLRTRAMELLKRVNLLHRLQATPNQMSGGEQQRCAIARALINDPALIVADEPTGNLDSKTSTEVMKIISELNAEGHTIVMVTHEDDIASYAKRIVRMKDGQVVSAA